MTRLSRRQCCARLATLLCGFAAAPRHGVPTSGHGRTVDMSRQLEAVLQHLRTERKAETLRRGWREMPTWVFCTTMGTIVNRGNVRRVFVRLLKRAKLPLHFSPHSLRHTFASLLLQQGESPVYVQRQLGHASIKLTVDTYGKWLPMGNKAAVDRLDTTGRNPRATAMEPHAHYVAVSSGVSWLPGLGSNQRLPD